MSSVRFWGDISQSQQHTAEHRSLKEIVESERSDSRIFTKQLISDEFLETDEDDYSESDIVSDSEEKPTAIELTPA